MLHRLDLDGMERLELDMGEFMGGEFRMEWLSG